MSEENIRPELRLKNTEKIKKLFHERNRPK